MTISATKARIASLRTREAGIAASEAEYTQLVREACAEALALPDWAKSRYAKISDRANRLEGIAIRLADERRAAAAERRELEAKLASSAVAA